MNDEWAKAIHQAFLASVEPAADTVERNIRLGISSMLGRMLEVFWKQCFPGDDNEVFRGPAGELAMEAFKTKWSAFVREQQVRWAGQAARCGKFGRRTEAVKEQIKLDQVERLLAIWNDALGTPAQGSGKSPAGGRPWM